MVATMQRPAYEAIVVATTSPHPPLNLMRRRQRASKYAALKDVDRTPWRQSPEAERPALGEVSPYVDGPAQERMAPLTHSSKRSRTLMPAARAIVTITLLGANEQ